MPHVDLEFAKLSRINYHDEFHFYSIKINDYSQLNELNGKTLALNNRNRIIENTIEKNKNLQKLRFDFIENEYENEIEKQIQKEGYNLKLQIQKIKNYIYIYLTFTKKTKKNGKENDAEAEYLTIFENKTNTQQQFNSKPEDKETKQNETKEKKNIIQQNNNITQKKEKLKNMIF